MSLVKMQNISPFNEAYFINCFYPSLFTAMRHFNGSVFSYVANYHYVYALKQTTKGLSLALESRESVPLTELNKMNGVEIEYKIGYRDDLIDLLIQALLNNKLVITTIDGYYYKHPYHDLFYSKQHHCHFILIYGFDSDRRVFKTVECNGMEWDTTNCCYTYEISFENLVTCHGGIVHDLKMNMTTGFLSKENPDHIVNDDPHFYRSTMIDNLKAHKNDILEGIHNISKLADNIEQFDISTEILFGNKIASLSNKYKMDNIFDDKEKEKFEPSLRKILDNWRMIEMMVYREMYGITIGNDRFTSRLHQLYQLESKLYEDVFRAIE